MQLAGKMSLNIGETGLRVKVAQVCRERDSEGKQGRDSSRTQASQNSVREGKPWRKYHSRGDCAPLHLKLKQCAVCLRRLGTCASCAHGHLGGIPTGQQSSRMDAKLS